MNLWRRSIWQIGALVALFASASPKPVWACPMTGRIGDAALICEGKMPSGELCASPGNTCCKSLPLPPLPNGGLDAAHEFSFLKATPVFSTALLRELAQSSGEPNITLLPGAPRHFAPDLREIACATTSLPPFLALHRPASQAGRAPPFIGSSSS